MPYIIKERRPDLTHSGIPLNVGELNFCITRRIVQYIDFKGLSYQTINDVIGVLECAKQELYDRKARDYENLKMAENGDVY